MNSFLGPQYHVQLFSSKRMHLWTNSLISYLICVAVYILPILRLFITFHGLLDIPIYVKEFGNRKVK